MVLLADSHRESLMALCVVVLDRDLFVSQRLYQNAISISLDNVFTLC